ncbi:MAG: hypothetical protein DSY37_04155, partial [Hyperthermus sp.]
GFTFFPSSREAELCIRGGSASRAEVVGEGYDTLVEWMKLLDTVEAIKPATVVVVGRVESGKSTLTVWLANRLGLGVIEGDVGQNEFGQPACVSFHEAPSNPILSLQDLDNPRCIFAGHVSAEKIPEIIIAAIIKAGKLVGGGYIVDTDGFIEGRGLFYKLSLIEAVQPDLVVVMGDNSLSHLLRSMGMDVIMATAVPKPRLRSRRERRLYRMRQWARLFTRANTFKMKNVEIIGLCSWKNEGDTILYNCPKSMYILGSRRGRSTISGVRRLKPGWEKGLVAGVKTKLGDYRLALIERIDLHDNSVVVRVNAPEDILKGEVKLGWIKLLDNFEEKHFEPLPYPEALVSKHRTVS